MIECTSFVLRASKPALKFPIVFILSIYELKAEKCKKSTNSASYGLHAVRITLVR